MKGTQGQVNVGSQQSVAELKSEAHGNTAIKGEIDMTTLKGEEARRGTYCHDVRGNGYVIEARTGGKKGTLVSPYRDAYTISRARFGGTAAVLGGRRSDYKWARRAGVGFVKN